jgi:hypothetical protein
MCLPCKKLPSKSSTASVRKFRPYRSIRDTLKARLYVVARDLACKLKPSLRTKSYVGEPREHLFSPTRFGPDFGMRPRSRLTSVALWRYGRSGAR